MFLLGIQFLPHIFWCFLIKHIENCQVFLEKWLLLSLCITALYNDNFLVLKSALSEISIATLAFIWLVLACIGEGNGKPLQCSCLENPRDGGAWWAPVYGVAQSWTRLKRLSSSSIVSLSPFLFFVSKLVFFFCGEQIVGFIFNPMTVSFI